MNLPRLMAMKEFWKDNPPVRIMLQAKFGITPKDRGSIEAESQVITDPEKAAMEMESMASLGVSYRG